jgi:hypothetical protein
VAPIVPRGSAASPLPSGFGGPYIRTVTLHEGFDRVRHHVRRPVSRTPYVWDAAMWVRPGKRSTLARRDTALVIEGFLRSGNTFSVAAFEVANGRHLHVARHLHGAPHVLRAARLGLPVVVLVRAPRDAVASYLVRRPTLTVSDALVEYLDFYETAWPVHDLFVVGLFEQVTADFGSVLETVNRRFGTSFAPYRPTPDAVRDAMARVEELNRLECHGEVVETHVGRPSAAREERKAEVARLMSAPDLRPLIDRTERLHAQYVDLARIQAAH